MIDTSFEKILFENAPKDLVQQAAENADAANKASAQAHKDANKAQANSNAANNLAAEVLGLKQGETLKPADVLAKLKSDPSILDKIAGNGNLLGLLKTSKENILALKNAPMLSPEETQQNNSEAAPQPTPQPQQQQPEQPAQPEQKGNAANVPEGNRNAIKVKLQGIAKELGQSEDDIIAYIKTL